MNKAIIAVVAIIIIGGGVFALTKKDSKDESSAPSSNTSSQDSSEQSENSNKNELDPNDYTSGANIGETVDATDKSEVKISIDDNIYKTTYLKIKKGTKVTWTNEGNIRHDVSSDDSSPKSGLASDLLGNGESYSFTFDEAGLYEYFCNPHPTQMRGVITVID